MTVESGDPADAENILETALEIYPETARFVLGTIQFNLIDSPKTPTEAYNRPEPARVLDDAVSRDLQVVDPLPLPQLNFWHILPPAPRKRNGRPRRPLLADQSLMSR